MKVTGPVSGSRMVKYICFCQMTSEFLQQSQEERKAQILGWRKIAKKHGLKTLFWGSTIGVKEQGVVVFEADKNHDTYTEFQREWLSLGTPDAGRYFVYTRTISVH